MVECKECHQEFVVSLQDVEILRKLDLPEPKICATHALQRRLSFRNERYLYRRNCELCQKSILANYSKESYVHVYCRKCWFSDQWDPTSYAREYDQGKSFIEQFFELWKEVPNYNLYLVGENPNSEYANLSFNSKDAYLSFSTVNSESVLYSKNTDYSRDIVDCAQTIKSELLYECVETLGSYHSAWLTHCDHCSECYLSRDLIDCQDCFGSVNLRHKRFYWFNEPLSEMEYKQHLQTALKDRESFEQQKVRFTQHQLKFAVEATVIRNSTSATGHDIFNSGDVRNSFNARDDENVSDVFRVYNSKDIFRETYAIYSELSYEGLAGPKRVQSVVAVYCPEVFQVNYSFMCESSQFLFGCIGLRGKKYHILNKEYSPKEYEDLRTQIIQSMRERGEWGEFFPTAISPQAYNDTVAFEYWPLTQAEVEKRGWRWQTEQPGIRGQEGPDVNTCQRCGLIFKLHKKEIELFQSFHLPSPLTCPECRFQARTPRTYIPALYDRVCQCQLIHMHHTGSCQTKLSSIYAPDRPEIVYCSKCYQAEVL